MYKIGTRIGEGVEGIDAKSVRKSGDWYLLEPRHGLEESQTNLMVDTTVIWRNVVCI